MRFLFPLAIISVLTLLFNTGREIYSWLKLGFKRLRLWIFATVFSLAVLIPAVLFVLSRVPNSPLPRFLLKMAHYDLGVLLYTVLCVNLVSFVLLILRCIRKIPKKVMKKVTLIAGASALALALGLSLGGILHGANLQTNRYKVTLDKGEGSLRIALVTDIHLGYVWGTERLSDIVDAIEKENVDVVCLAGDVFDGDFTALEDKEELQALLSSLDCRFGVYACLGNHDAGDSYGEMVAFLRDAGVTVLFDDYVRLGDTAYLAGRRDSSPIGGHGNDRTALTLPEDGLPVIVMDHRPDNIDEYGEETDLILCGHTHKGQMFPLNLITDAIYDVDYGWYQASETAPQVIVSSGAGSWGPPMRVASDCEIVIVDLTLGA